MARTLRIAGGRPLQGEIRVSGAKNAVLPVLAATILTEAQSRIDNVPGLADVENSLAILEAVGVKAERDGASVTVSPGSTIGSEVPTERARQMRASLLFLGPLVARTGRAVLPHPGGDDIGMRRVDQHLYGLEQLGATVEEVDGNLVCRAGRLIGAEIQLDMPTVTGTENLMMAACLAEGRTTIANAAREPHVRDLADALTTMGARIEGAGSDRIHIEGVEELGGIDHRVMPDYLEAGTYAIAAAAVGGDVTLQECPVPDLRSLVLKLRHAGVDVEVGEDWMRIRRDGPLQPVDLITWTHPGFATDLQPQFTALMTQAAGSAVVQEFLFENRFQYIDELRALGARIDLFPHRRGIRIDGPCRLRGNVVTIPDIRAGAALVIAGLCAEGRTMLLGMVHLDRGYEDMPGKLSRLGAEVAVSVTADER
jgi:UDP-N-acetylglucosamine 1-carboxyvinyltransferase